MYHLDLWCLLCPYIVLGVKMIDNSIENIYECPDVSDIEAKWFDKLEDFLMQIFEPEEHEKLFDKKDAKVYFVRWENC